MWISNCYTFALSISVASQSWTSKTSHGRIASTATVFQPCPLMNSCAWTHKSNRAKPPRKAPTC